VVQGVGVWCDVGCQLLPATCVYEDDLPQSEGTGLLC
jgi:hypothetical protein